MNIDYSLYDRCQRFTDFSRPVPAEVKMDGDLLKVGLETSTIDLPLDKASVRVVPWRPYSVDDLWWYHFADRNQPALVVKMPNKRKTVMLYKSAARDTRFDRVDEIIAERGSVSFVINLRGQIDNWGDRQSMEDWAQIQLERYQAWGCKKTEGMFRVVTPELQDAEFLYKCVSHPCSFYDNYLKEQARLAAEMTASEN